MERLDNMIEKSSGRSLEDILTNGYQLDAMAAVSRGFNILGKDIGSYIGFCLLSFIISIVIGMAPFVGTIASLIIGPALHAGYANYLKAYLHHDSSAFSNFFNGFKSPQLLQLALSNFIAQIIAGVVAVVIIVAFCGNIALELMANMEALQDPTDSEAQKAALAFFMTSQFILGFVVAFFAAISVSLLWMLTSQFIVFRQMAFWDAMEASRKIVMKKFFSFLGWIFVWIIILGISALPCGLGLLFTYPAFMLSLYALYMQITEDEAVLNH
jgi:hypothetical protein